MPHENNQLVSLGRTEINRTQITRAYVLRTEMTYFYRIKENSSQETDTTLKSPKSHLGIIGKSPGGK